MIKIKVLHDIPFDGFTFRGSSVLFTGHIEKPKHILNHLSKLRDLHDKVGLLNLDVKILPINGEENLTNNAFTKYIDVIDYSSSILILKNTNTPSNWRWPKYFFYQTIFC